MINDKEMIRDCIKSELTNYSTLAFISMSGRFDMAIVMQELINLKNEGFDLAINYCNLLDKRGEKL